MSPPRNRPKAGTVRGVPRGIVRPVRTPAPPIAAQAAIHMPLVLGLGAEHSASADMAIEGICRLVLTVTRWEPHVALALLEACRARVMLGTGHTYQQTIEELSFMHEASISAMASEEPEPEAGEGTVH